MTPNKTLTRARRYADGDGVLIDLERARDLYAEIADSLTGDDLTLYRELCVLYPSSDVVIGPAGEIAPISAVCPMNELYSPTAVAVAPMLVSTPSITPTPQQLRSLLDELLAHADEATLGRIYSALIKISDPHSVRKEENIVFGNNLRVLLFQCGKRSSDLCFQMSLRGMKLTPAAVSRKISGQDGTSKDTLGQILKVFNEVWIPHLNCFRDPCKVGITSEDMYLPPDQFFRLFKSPKVDDGLRKFLRNIGVTVDA